MANTTGRLFGATSQGSDLLNLKALTPTNPQRAMSGKHNITNNAIAAAISWAAIVPASWLHYGLAKATPIDGLMAFVSALLVGLGLLALGAYFSIEEPLD